MLRAAVSVWIALAGCGGSKAEDPSKAAPLRAGHLYVNGNCAVDSEKKLTGQCEGSGKNGCITHEPDPESPPCQIGLVVTEARPPACSTGASSDVVSREHQCFFVER